MSAIKFRVGDEVVIKRGLDVSKRYGGWAVTNEMVYCAGESDTVVGILLGDEYEYPSYLLKDHGHYWTDEMLDIVPYDDDSLVDDIPIEDFISMLSRR